MLRYLKGTVNYGILYSKDSSNECVGFSDADWAGDINDRKSMFKSVGALLRGGARNKNVLLSQPLRLNM